jgi:hypothetical protein
MPITVKHSKTSAIPDAGDTTLVQPSDWNADHTLTGLGTMAEQNANAVAITGGTMSGVAITGYIPTTEKAAALGVATLDAGGTVPLSQIPASIQGGVSYQGTWNASTNTPTLSNGVGTKGYYYVVSVAGNTNLDGITSWNVGDWAIFNGTVWQKVDNTDAVTSVNGYTGTVVLTNTDISGFGSMSTQNANAVAITGGTINGTTIGATTATTGAFTTATASTSVTTPIVQATNSGGLALRNSAGTTQISMGAGGGDNVSINVPTNINGANAQIDISPTGTGHVHIKPTGTGSLEIAPTNAGTMNNMVIGGTTPLAITGTTITATSFVGSGASLTNVVNSAAAGTGISVSASTGAVTITNTAPDQTVSIAAGTGISTSGTYPSFTVTNTAPDQTVALASGTGISVTGTYPNFTVTNTSPSSGGTVTSVGGTGTVNGISLSGTVTSSGNLTLGGTLSNVSLATQVTGTLPIANGGTGQTTANAAYNALSPMTTTGDITYEATGGIATRLPIGTTGQVLTVSSGIPAWAAAGGGGFPAGTVMLFAQTSAPTGWTKNTTTGDNSAIRVVTGTASTGGSVAFTTAFASQTPAGSVSITAVSGSASATTLTTPQIPSHTHTTKGVASPSPGSGGLRGLTAPDINTGATGGGGSHTHPFSFTSGSGTFTGTAINLAVQYIDVIRATKD